MTAAPSLAQNVHRLIRAHITMTHHGQIANQDALIDQLAAAVKPGIRVGGTGQSGDYLPINTAAVDLWQEINDDIRLEEHGRTGDSTGTLKAILARWETEDRHEWEPHLTHVTQDIIDRIKTLLDPPPKRRPLNAPCYDCGELWADNAGERTPAVTIGTHHPTGELRELPDMDMSCAACGKTWHGEEMRWPLRVINQDTKV